MFKNFMGMAAVAACAALAPVAAMACPDWQGAPHFGNIELGAGFMPDPFVRNITAGGTSLLENCGLNASGYVTPRPDFDLYWNGQSAQLTIAVESNADAILLVNGPNGEWYYNDDYYNTNPAIVISNPTEGLYDIWIGSYDGSRRNPGRLIITELDY